MDDGVPRQGQCVGGIQRCDVGESLGILQPGRSVEEVILWVRIAPGDGEELVLGDFEVGLCVGGIVNWEVSARNDSGIAKVTCFDCDADRFALTFLQHDRVVFNHLSMQKQSGNESQKEYGEGFD